MCIIKKSSLPTLRPDRIRVTNFIQANCENCDHCIDIDFDHNFLECVKYGHVTFDTDFNFTNIPECLCY